MTTTSDYMLACAGLRRVSPAAPIPDAGRSVRERGAWLLMAADGEPIATVGDAGTVALHSGHIIVVEHGDADIVEAQVVTWHDTRWQCSGCGRRWAKLGQHVGAVKECRGCGALLWLQGPPA